MKRNKPFVVVAEHQRTMRAPQKPLIHLKWSKDRKTGLCFVTTTSSHTATFLKADRPRLQDILGRVILYATQCRKKSIRLESADIERVFPELVFPDHLLTEIIDAPQTRSAKQVALRFYAELTGRTEASIERDLFR